jgi:hypothetical protein
MNRLFRPRRTTTSFRPSILSIVALMVLLVPTVLHTSTGEKTVAMGLDLAGHSGARTHDGALSSVTVRAEQDGFRIEAVMESTDVTGDRTIEESMQVSSLTDLQNRLTRLKAIDSSQTHLTLVPSPDSTAGQIVQWMDAIRIGPEGELFSHVTLGTAS